MPRPHYNGAYQRMRRALVGKPCWQCGQPATTADHYPPLSRLRPGERWNGVLRPMCVPCMRKQAGQLGGARPRFARSRAW